MGNHLSEINEIPQPFALKVRNPITGNQAQKKASPRMGWPSPNSVFSAGDDSTMDSQTLAHRSSYPSPNI